MKINNSNLESVPFSSLAMGEVFVFLKNTFMRIPEITTAKKGTSYTYNTYNLLENDYTYFFGSEEVLPYPNATLNLIP